MGLHWRLFLVKFCFLENNPKKTNPPPQKKKSFEGIQQVGWYLVTIVNWSAQTFNSQDQERCDGRLCVDASQATISTRVWQHPLLNGHSFVSFGFLERCYSNEWGVAWEVLLCLGCIWDLLNLLSGFWVAQPNSLCMVPIIAMDCLVWMCTEWQFGNLLFKWIISMCKFWVEIGMEQLPWSLGSLVTGILVHDTEEEEHTKSRACSNGKISWTA